MTEASQSAWRQISRGIIILVVLVLAWLFVEHTPRTATICVIAALTAFGAHPVMMRLQKRMPKGAAIAIIFLGLTLFIVFGLVIAVPLIIEQTQSLNANLPSYVSTLQQWLATSQSSLQQHLPGLRVQPATFDLGKIGSDRLDSIGSSILAGIAVIVVNTSTAFFVGFSAIVLSIMFLVYDTKIAQSFVALFPPSRRDTAQAFSNDTSETFGRYISGQVTVSAITGLVVALLSAIIGFKYPWLLFILTFIGYSIPMFGMAIAQAIAIVLSAPQGLWMVIWIQVIMFTIGRISDNVLVPKIMGSSVGVSPIGIMLAVFAGGELFGFGGLVLAVPLAAFIKILWRYFGGPWWHAQFDDSRGAG